jgi:hypothetical protein
LRRDEHRRFDAAQPFLDHATCARGWPWTASAWLAVLRRSTTAGKVHGGRSHGSASSGDERRVARNLLAAVEARGTGGSTAVRGPSESVAARAAGLLVDSFDDDPAC